MAILILLMSRWMNFSIPIEVDRIIKPRATDTARALNLDFYQLLADTLAFSNTDPTVKPIPTNALLMLTDVEYQRFLNQYFQPRKWPPPPLFHQPDTAVIFIQIPGTMSHVQTYGVENIQIENGVVVVNLQQRAGAEILPAPEFRGVFNWVLLLEIDKSLLNDSTQVKVKRWARYPSLLDIQPQ